MIARRSLLRLAPALLLPRPAMARILGHSGAGGSLPISPDGSSATSPGQFVYNAYGKWGLGALSAPAPGYGGGPFYVATLNGKSIPGQFNTQQIQINYGGEAFLSAPDQIWSQWWKYTLLPNHSVSFLAPTNDGFHGPLPPVFTGYTPSPDGSTISGPSGMLTTADGNWTFGAGPDGNGNWQCLLNGVQIQQNATADMLEVNAQGTMFVHASGFGPGWTAWTQYRLTPVFPSPVAGPIPIDFTYASANAAPIIHNQATTGTAITLTGVSTDPKFAMTPVMSDGSQFTGSVTVPPNDLGDVPFVPTLTAGTITFVSRTNPISSSPHSSNSGAVTVTQNTVPCSLSYYENLLDP
jgi:hypothetical protein